MSQIRMSTGKWWQPQVHDYGRVILPVMRLLFALLIFETIKWETAPYTEQKFPNGIAHWVDLTWLADHPPGVFWQGLTVGFLAVYVVGWVPAIGLLPVLVFSIAIGTLITSQSKNVNHSWQMVTMMLLGQWLTYLWAAWKGKFWRPSVEVHRLAVYVTTVVIAASYVVCGVVKLDNSSFQWVQKVPLLSLQLLKSNWAHYYDTLDRPPPWLEQATQWIVEYPNVARLFFGTGLLIELGAFVILINRRWAFWGGVAIVALHLSISQVMQLNFMNHMAAAMIFLVIPNVKVAFGRQAGAGEGRSTT